MSRRLAACAACAAMLASAHAMIWTPLARPVRPVLAELGRGLDPLQRQMLGRLAMRSGDAFQGPHICFAPGTPASTVEAFYAAAATSSHQLESFRLGTRWSNTAIDGSGLQQGDPTMITWGIVPDGTPIAGFAGEPPGASDLIASFNAIYGSQAIWQALFQQVFDRWGSLIGARYVFESNDDGASLATASGVSGTRADVRIGGHFIDGSSGVLAYNFFPNNGDMILDTSDSFFSDTSSNSIGLRNVVSHEQGHGLGSSHVCPVDKTKLMEPFATVAFDGPQHDDILTGNRAYGDSLEHNDSTGSATPLGTLPNGPAGAQAASVDDDGDVDYYRFSVPDTSRQVTVTVSPRGSTYLEGAQFGSGACSAGTSFDSRSLKDLAVDLIGPNGTSVLATANAQAAGGTESVVSFPLSMSAGPYYVRVFGGSADTAQLYDLSLVIADAAPIPPPGPVTNLTATINNFDVILTWSPAAGATSYVLEASSGPGLADLAIQPVGNVTSVTATGPAGVYFVAARGVNGAIQGPRSSEAIVILPGGGCTAAPAAPTGLVGTVTGRTVTLTWTGPAGCQPTSHVVEAGSMPGLSDRTRFDTLSVATTIVMEGVPAGTYFVRVFGRNLLGPSGPSNEIVVVVS